MKKWIKTVIAIVMSALTLFGAVACGKIETPQGIKEYLCVEHTYGAGEIERKSTCIREGRVKYTCSECGNEKVEVTARSAHVPYTVPARAATCAQTGYTEHTACATCGQTLEGKVTTPKTACDHTNDFYAGMGIYECSLCGNDRKFYNETVATVEDFSMTSWYRCYLPNENSRASITFYSNVRRKSPFGYIVEPSENIPIYKFTLILSYSSLGPNFSVILFDDAGETYNATMQFKGDLLSGSHDYTEMIFDKTFWLSGKTELPYDLFCDVKFENVTSFTDDSGIYKVESIELENGAEFVKLSIGIGGYPEG